MQASPATQATAPKAAVAPLCPDHALDALRAARLRRQLADEGSSIFVHAPRPAIVPSEPEYAEQRRFGAGVSFRDTALTPTEREAASLGAELRVFRNADRDVAEVTAALGLYTRAKITICLHPYELRDLAARLIDAAHDIETHPAAALAIDQEAV